MEYREFLKTTLPHLGLRWSRFKKRNIKRRVINRLQELGLQTLGEYQTYVLESEEERQHLSALLTVTISRFWRNANLFEALETSWLPAVLARVPAGEPLRIWSAGCASGEEPYSLLILWQERFADSGRKLLLIASDSDSHCLERAQQGLYPASSFREMPLPLRQKYFTNEGGIFCIAQDLPNQISWIEHNLIWDPPFAGNHLIFCRNLAYTYFTEPLQQEITQHLHDSLLSGGLLVVGRKDRLPVGSERLFLMREHPVYERLSDANKEN